MDTLGKHFQALTRAAFSAHGFGQAEVLSQWNSIVGEALARAARPERIRWPRASAKGQQLGGTLVVRAMAGRGLEVQQQVPLLIERVNRYLGYGAIMAVKIVQSHEVLPATEAPSAAPPLAEPPAGISDPALAEALQRLGGGVAAAASRSPTRSPTRSPQGS